MFWDPVSAQVVVPGPAHLKFFLNSPIPQSQHLCNLYKDITFTLPSCFCIDLQISSCNLWIHVKMEKKPEKPENVVARKFTYMQVFSWAMQIVNFCIIDSVLSICIHLHWRSFNIFSCCGDYNIFLLHMLMHLLLYNKKNKNQKNNNKNNKNSSAVQSC